MNRTFLIILLFCGLGFSSAGQSAIVRDFRPVCDTLDVRLKENRDVKGQLRLQNVMKRGNKLDFYFTESLGDYPWREGEPEWFRKELKKLFPAKYRNYGLGEIYSKRIKFSELVTEELGYDGDPGEFKYRTENPERKNPLVRRVDEPEYSKGLSNRNIAVWQSHGRYFDKAGERWIWQRPCLFQTVEDMYTQSFVLPYLVPMLENAGAYVMLPRERDTQIHEVIVDYDETDDAYGKSSYEESGKWKEGGTGFAAKKPTYVDTENPFTSGTYRVADCVEDGKKKESTAVWRPEIPERGEYAVYVSYKSLPESSPAVSYTVTHLGGRSEFIVNQKIGGGTWIYLGTFEFDKGSKGNVTMSSLIPSGYDYKRGSVVTADAVKFGGGIGNMARALPAKDGEVAEEPIVSGLPRSAEGARYWLQWAGIDEEIFSQNELKDDYRDDFMSRGDWVEWISRGSDMNPSKKKGLGIPVDLALGFHSDAGTTPNDSIVGTLAIYTMKSEGAVKLPGGEHRMTSRELADHVQTQIINDITEEFDPLWSRRCIWDRSYRESRTPSCPSMLLELLSHQNFADMKYGLDPTFRFTVSRAVYKGMLKYLSNRYGVPYMVQPLPVQSMGVGFGSEGKAVITWRETEDKLEPTAKASGFILYTRVDDGGFDNGRIIDASRNSKGLYYVEVPVETGKIYSFRIAAANEGGRSFPSETVSIGIPAKAKSTNKILIVNNFDRVSGPAFIDMPFYAGFNNRLDSGVPYVKDIAYVGDMFEFRRDFEYISNNNSGFGASYDDYAGKAVAGNTFDYPYVHGKAFMDEGYAFYSCSNEAFTSEEGLRADAWATDIICGKQVTTVVGTSQEQKFRVFPYELQSTLKEFTSGGGHVLISGANIATDAWDNIYPMQVDSTYRETTQKFIKEVLGYKWVRNHAGRTGGVKVVKSKISGTSNGKEFEFHNEINPECYCVETPDGITPNSTRTGSAFIRYSDSMLPAGICFNGNGYKTVSIGFPIETIKKEKDINNIIRITLEFFNR